MVSGKGKGKGNNKYRRGRALEYRVKKWLEERGFHVIRSAGSHGRYDLVAISDREIVFIQCKLNQPSKLIELEKMPCSFLQAGSGWKEFLEQQLGLS